MSVAARPRFVIGEAALAGWPLRRDRRVSSSRGGFNSRLAAGPRLHVRTSAYVSHGPGRATAGEPRPQMGELRR